MSIWLLNMNKLKKFMKFGYFDRMTQQHFVLQSTMCLIINFV